MGSSYRRLEVQLPQFFLQAQREAEACAVEVQDMEKEIAEKQRSFQQKDDRAAKLLRDMCDAGASDQSATVPGLALFLEQYWSDEIPRDPERVQEVRWLRASPNPLPSHILSLVLPFSARAYLWRM
eukprot:COSAG02_NODE_2671_length_8285_cov_18.268752_1_plen_126_part_00